MFSVSLKLRQEISLRKILVSGFLGQKWPKWIQNLFKFYEKSMQWIFLIFKLQELDGLQFTQNCTGVLAKRGAKLVFLSFTTNWCIEFFGVYACSYCSIKAENWVTFFFERIFVWRFFWGTGDPTLSPEWGALSFMGELKHDMLVIFCMKLQ